MNPAPMAQPAPQRHDGLASTKHPILLDLVLALPTSSAFRSLIQARRDRGDWPKPLAHVFAQGDRYFAVVSFHGQDHSDLVYALDVWVWNGPGGGGA
jgi:hypothetical protein